MKAIKAKAKPKKPNGKFGKVKFAAKEVPPIDPDLSQLRPPIDTSVSTLYRVSKVLENGSEEVRSILAYECDLVYECRICRSLFRSLANFISHKRIYCKERFDITFMKISSNDYDTTCVSKVTTPEPEKASQDVAGNDRMLRSKVPKEEQKKDLTTVVSMLQKKQAENFQTTGEHLYLETVHSNSSAVYQTIESTVSAQNCSELMKGQVMELKNISEQAAVLGPNGQLVQPDHNFGSNSATEFENYEESGTIYENYVTCSICQAKFSTKKTLAVHTRTLHTSYRLCYPCPCCASTFANTWSVYRHLFKVHRKSSDEVRKLRSQIQEKAFIKDSTVAEDMQREDANKILVSKTLSVNETQEWIDHLECDAELQRCGGCGKRFDRKAALSSHSQYCHRRVAACESTTKIKKIKVPPDCTSSETITTVSEIEKNNVVAADSSSVEINNCNETSIRVETVATLSKEDWEMLNGADAIAKSVTNHNFSGVVTNGLQENAKKHGSSPASDVSDPLEIVYTSINDKPKPKTYVGSKRRKNKDSVKKLTTEAENVEKNIPVPVTVNDQQEKQITKMDHVLLMEKKISSIVNLQKLQCLPCKRKFTSVNNLRRHAAIHVGWNRYQCKLCDYKCFVKCDCVAHCNKIHNAQNNRVIIEEMIIQIPEDQFKCEQNIMLNITNSEEEVQTPKVIEISIPISHAEVEGVERSGTEVEMEIVNVNPDVLHQDVVHVNGEAEESLNNSNKETNTLGLDPDLRKMVMEVIFGSSDVNSTKQTQARAENSNSKQQNKDADAQSKNTDTKEGDVTSIQDNLKPQRPIRNKIKPLNKDFIYDLKEVTLRKDSFIAKPFNKTLVKKSLIQAEENLEKDVEQPSKRLKSVQDDEISILCESSVIEKCDIKIERDLKNNFSYSQ